MKQKFFIRREEAVLGIAFDREKKAMLLYAPIRWREQAEEVMEVFNVLMFDLRKTSGKLKGRFAMDEGTWEKGLKLLSVQGWFLEPTRSFRRLAR